MKLFNREIPVRKLSGIIVILIEILPHIFLVKNPLTVIIHYIRRTSPEFIDLRDGTRILLSKHPHDIITFVLIFLRRHYGKVRPGSIVMDIGANIGVFSIYAALSGAKRIYAFEPSVDAFNILCENVKQNDFSEVIIPVNKAVSNIGEIYMKFPEASSPYNRIETEMTGDEQNFSEIQTVTIGSFIKSLPDDLRIDLLKMDCEGEEFKIIPSLDSDTLYVIDSIRLECHGNPDVINEYLCRNNFREIRRMGDDIWFSKSSRIFE